MKALGAMVLLIIALGGAFLVGYCRPFEGKEAIQPVIQHSCPTITQLERLADLVSMKVHVSDVLTASDDDFQGSWLIKGDALIAVDLGRAKLTIVDEQQHQAAIELPAPAVRSARVNHERTKKWDVRRVSWHYWRGDQDSLRDRAMLEAQALIEHAAGAEETIGEARLRAQSIIKGFYSMIGWRVSIQWLPAAAQKMDKS